MQYSIAKKGTLNEEFRIDAEYYSLENLTKEDAVTRHDYRLLSDICELIAGPFGSTITTERYDATSDKCYIRGKDVQSFFIGKRDAVFIDENLFNELPQFHLRAEDILLTVVGMRFGKAAIVYPEDCPAIFSCKSTLLRNPSVNVRYLLTYLSSSIGYGLVRRGQRGAAQPGINLFDIRNIPVPIFSSKFQAKIEIFIKQSRHLVTASDAAFSEAETLLLFEVGLTDWQPKHELTFVKNYSDIEQAGRIDADYFQPKYEEIVNAIKNYSSGWDMLGNLVTIEKCVEVGSDEYLDRGIPFVRVSNLSPFEITEEKYISDNLYEEMKRHQPKKGEILLSKDATPGIAYYLNEPPPKMIPSGGILRLKNKTSKTNDEYLTLVLNSVLTKEQANQAVGGSVILHWRPDQVKNTAIPILPDEIQTKIQQKVTESFALRKQSRRLLECAKRAVEVAIEQDENTALLCLEKEARHERKTTPQETPRG